jgi:quinol monooxygenase YgiN
MRICQTGAYQVKADSVDKVRQGVTELTDYVKESEPGTVLYFAWQERDEPTRFMHLAVFDDETALEIHHASKALRRFEKLRDPHIVGGPAFFTEYDEVAGKPETTCMPAGPCAPLSTAILSEGMD